MKTITIDIADSAYSLFRSLLKKLPKDSFVVHEYDPDELLLEERKEVYRLKNQTDKNDFSEFENWDEIKDTL